MEHSEGRPDDESTDDANPLPLEPVVEARTTCPECGAMWRGAAAEPCLRCGFDPRPRVPTGPPAVGAAADPDASGPVAVGVALLRPRELGRWLWGIGLGAIAINAIGALAGAPGLRGASEVVDWPDRLETFARGPLLVGLWGISGFLALAAVAWLRARPLGDPLLVLGRALAIVAVGRTAALIGAPWPIVEFGAETLVQSIACGLGVWALFRLDLRDVLITLGLAVSVFIVLYAGAHLVTWIAA